jgi:hypothetical protein
MPSQTNTISPSTLINLSEFIRLEAATTAKNTTVVQPVFKTKTDQTFTYIDAFLQGFRSNDVLPSA